MAAPTISCLSASRLSGGGSDCERSLVVECRNRRHQHHEGSAPRRPNTVTRSPHRSGLAGRTSIDITEILRRNESRLRRRRAVHDDGAVGAGRNGCRFLRALHGVIVGTNPHAVLARHNGDAVRARTRDATRGHDGAGHSLKNVDGCTKRRGRSRGAGSAGNAVVDDHGALDATSWDARRRRRRAVRRCCARGLRRRARRGTAASCRAIAASGTSGKDHGRDRDDDRSSRE
ncbi:MAG: hypothetical protein QOF28_2940 [Actinomycetota bacterium]|nr:hypothetical protein [Actinomycetota bacterium]